MTKNLICQFLILFLLFQASFTHASIVHGEVYDISFNKLTNAIIEINSIPKQSYIVKNIGYSFNLSPGNYTIKAFYIKNNDILHYNEEFIEIKDLNGDYNLDLILFPNVDDSNITNLNFPLADLEDKDKQNKFSILLVILSIISILVVIYLINSFIRTNKKTQVIRRHLEDLKKLPLGEQPLENGQKNPEKKDQYLEKTYNIIKQEKRINQRDLRKILMLSEAKVSLMITQLELEGKIKKIKKGRGNIVVFLK